MDDSTNRRIITTTTTTTRRVIRRVNYNAPNNGNAPLTSSSTTVTTIRTPTGASVAQSPTKIPRPSAVPMVHSPDGSPSVQLPLSPTSVEITGGGQVIEPIDISFSYTAEELDEKRENEKAYEYLHRLTEVRNWLKECIRSDSIAKETELEQNLSNGVLLARVANSFAPDIVQISKIFDIDQSRYYKDGQPCYRHTENISLWNKAVRSVHFPEILIPDTVDIYEGRNIKTIFSLFALAKHLHRMRRGPPIRREDNLQFSPSTLVDARERLKNSDLTLFGNIDEILATTPGDLNAHMKAVMELNNSLNNKESLLHCLKSPDTGILYVNDKLIDEYQKGLLKRIQSLSSNEFLNREQIQSVISEINDASALKQLEYVLQGRKKPEVSELNVILDDLQQEDTLRSAGPLYAEELYKIRSTQKTPLTLEQVEHVLKVVNMCMRVRFYALENDERGIYEALKSEPLGLENIVRPEFKAAYKNMICEEYKKGGKDYVLMFEQLRNIVEEVHGEVMRKGQVQNVALACRTDDYGSLAEALKGIKGFREELIIHYLKPLKDGKFTTVREIEIIVRKVNDQAADLKRLQDILAASRKNDSKALAKALKGITAAREDLAPYYLETLKRSSTITNLSDVEAIIIRINETVENIRKKVHSVEEASVKGDNESLARALKDMKAVEPENMLYYVRALRNGHYITIEEIEEIIKSVNQAVETDRAEVQRIQKASQEDDYSSLTGLLKDLKDVKAEYVPNYAKAFRSGHYRTIEEIQEAIDTANRTVEKDRARVLQVSSASQKGDLNSLSKVLRPLKNVREELMPYYQQALKGGSYNTVEEIEEVISEVNRDYDSNNEKALNGFHIVVDAIVSACQKGDSKILAEALKGIRGVHAELIPHYIRALKNRHYVTIEEIEEIIMEVNETDKPILQRMNDIKSACEQNDAGQLAKALRGIKGVREDIMDQYLVALRSSPYSTMEDIEMIIARANQTPEASQIIVRDVVAACQKGTIKVLLKALQGVPEVREDLAAYYLQALKNAQYTTVQEIIEIIIQINETVEETRKKVALIQTASQDDNLDALERALHDVRGILPDLMSYYMKALRNARYNTLKEVEEIINRTNETVATGEADKEQLKSIAEACQNEDYDDLLRAVCSLKGFREEFLPYYMFALKKRPVSRIGEAEEIIGLVNRNVAIAESNLRDTAHLNKLISEGRKDEAAKLLAKSWRRTVRNDLLPEYMSLLTEDIVVRKKKSEAQIGVKNNRYLSEHFPDGTLYLNVDNGQVSYRQPDKFVEWMLTRGEIEKIIEMINDKHPAGAGHKSDKEIAQNAAEKIQRWWRTRMFYNDLSELRTSEKPRLRVVRRFAPMLLRTKQDQKEDTELEENKAYATKLINANRQLEESLMDLNHKIVKLSDAKTLPAELKKILESVYEEANKTISRDIPIDKDRLKWDPYEIIFFYMQTKPDYFVRLMAKHSDQLNVLPDLFRRSILPVYSYGSSKREMSLMALLLRNYFHEEIKKLIEPTAFRTTQFCTILQILMEMYGKMEAQRSQITELNKKLVENQAKHFNLNPTDVYESVTGNKPKNVDEAMGNAVVTKVINDSKAYLTKWAMEYAAVIFGNNSKYPDIIRYIAISIKSDMKKHFPSFSNDIIMQAVGVWVFKGCWEGEITAAARIENDKENEDVSLAVRRVICKFIEYGVLNFGYGVEKYWMNSLNETIGKINSLSIEYVTTTMLCDPPVYRYSIEDELRDRYGKRRPVLFIATVQLHITQRRLQNNVNEIVPEKSSRLHRLIVDTLPPDDKAEYATLHLHPFATDETDNREDLFRRAMRNVEQCLLSGCPGNTLTQLLARHTLQTEEDNFQKLPHLRDDRPTLDDTKRSIVQQLSALEKTGRVTSVNSFQDIVTAVAKDINEEHNYRKNRKTELVTSRKLVMDLEKDRAEIRKRLEAYDNYLKKKIDRQQPAQADAGADKTPAKLLQKRSTQRQRCTLDKLVKNGVVTAVSGYPSLKGCGNITLDISTTERPGILLFKISEPSKQALFQTELDLKQLDRAATDPNGTLNIADKMTVNAQKLAAYINQSIFAKKY